jgi:hypothetical protein
VESSALDWWALVDPDQLIPDDFAQQILSQLTYRVNQLARRRSLSMNPSNAATTPAELSQQKAEFALTRDGTDCGAPGPMPQQNAGDCHGHEMHPQKFVRLIGCHDSAAARHDPAPGPDYLSAA